MKILIVGGTGAFGSFYGKIFQKNGFDVFISSRNPIIGKEEAKKNGLSFDENPNYANYNVIALSIPNEVAPKLVTTITKKMNKESLLFDFCSVKKEICKAMRKEKKQKVGLLSIHPMHGPRVKSITGYPIAWIEINKNKMVEEIKRVLENEGAKIVQTSEEEHDKILSLVQGLTHYSQFVAATTIYDMGIDLGNAQKFATPNYSLFLSLLSRVITQNPELYAEIQLSNPANEKVRKLFSKNALKLEKICSKKDHQNLTKEIIHDAQVFKNAEIMLLESDRAVNALKYTINILRDHIGKEFLVENMITHHYHYGVIEKIDDGELILTEGKQCSKLSIPKLRITTKKELLEWKKQNIGENYLDYSFLVPKNAEKKIIPKLFAGIKNTRIEVIDEFESNKFPNGKKSVTIRVNFFSNEEKEKINENILKISQVIGFYSR